MGAMIHNVPFSKMPAAQNHQFLLGDGNCSQYFSRDQKGSKCHKRPPKAAHLPNSESVKDCKNAGIFSLDIKQSPKNQS